MGLYEAATKYKVPANLATAKRDLVQRRLPATAAVELWGADGRPWVGRKIARGGCRRKVSAGSPEATNTLFRLG
eukprot:4818422-Heterocapsa_arctica.AAC.1